MRPISYFALRAKAWEVGLDDIRITDAEPITTYQTWIMARAMTGNQTEFEPEPLGLSRDPHTVVEKAKHVIVVAKKYPRIRRKPTAEGLYLADIAVGVDYHRIMRPAVLELAAMVERVTGASVYYQVDTGRLQERSFAEKAGLGFIGRNTCLIHPEYGTYLTLGLIVTDAEITDLPGAVDQSDSCGECRKCETVCPGRALSEYRLHAKYCISYLTQKTVLSAEEKRQIFSVYGCDQCQRACPKNEVVPEVDTDEPFVMPFSDLLLTKREFRDKYGHTAAFWRGQTILKRNLLLGMGNRKNPDYEELVQQLIKSESPALRAAAWYCLERLDQR